MVTFNHFSHSLSKRDGGTLSQARDYSGRRCSVHGTLFTGVSNKQTQKSLQDWLCYKLQRTVVETELCADRLEPSDAGNFEPLLEAASVDARARVLEGGDIESRCIQNGPNLSFVRWASQQVGV